MNDSRDLEIKRLKDENMALSLELEAALFALQNFKKTYKTPSLKIDGTRTSSTESRALFDVVASVIRPLVMRAILKIYKLGKKLK